MELKRNETVRKIELDAIVGDETERIYRMIRMLEKDDIEVRNVYTAPVFGVLPRRTVLRFVIDEAHADRFLRMIGINMEQTPK